MSNSRWLFQLRALPRAAIAVAACAGASSALAQNAANGQTLYRQQVNIGGGSTVSCEDCHGPAYLFRAASSAGAISSAIAADKGPGMGAFSFMTSAQINDIAAYVLTAAPPPPPPPFTGPPGSVPATPSASPNPLMLPNTAVGATSSVLNVQFTNTAASNVTFGTPAIGAATGDAADFLVAAPTSGNLQCINGRAIAPGMSCWFGVQFKPAAAGSKSASWTINFVGGPAPRTLTLQGTATTTASSPAPAPTPAPSSANAPTSGAGALGWESLLGLTALSGLAAFRRRTSR